MRRRRTSEVPSLDNDEDGNEQRPTRVLRIGEAPEVTAADTESDDADFDPEEEAERAVLEADAMFEEGSIDEGDEADSAEDDVSGEGDANEQDVGGGEEVDITAPQGFTGTSDSDEDEEGEEEEGTVVQISSQRGFLMRLFQDGLRAPRVVRRRSEHAQDLPLPLKPLENSLGIETRIGTAPEDPRLSMGPATPSPTSEARACASSSSSPSTPAGSPTGPRPTGDCVAVTPREMLRRREMGLAVQGLGCTPGGLSPAQCSHLCSTFALPVKPVRVLDRQRDAAYTGRFSADGSLFVAGFKSRHILMYDVRNDWKLVKDVEAVQMRWTITDTSFSHDQRFLLYCTLDSVAYMCTVAASGQVSSVSNMTDVHESFDVARMEGAGPDRVDSMSRYNIWAIRFSGDGRHFIAGAGYSLCVHDIERQRTVQRADFHMADLNAVCYLDPESRNIIATGSDDNMITLWDRRQMRRCSHKPVGFLPGHTEGITHLDPRGDDRYLISNGKDQCVKLWDIRAKRDKWTDQDRKVQGTLMISEFDYRHELYPPARAAKPYTIIHPRDASIQTYRGHHVVSTLIRAYFSPAQTTGQRFIYSGDSRGGFNIWDMVSGEHVHKASLDALHNDEVVRDVAWSPVEPMLVTASFDGVLVEWRPDSFREGRLHSQDLASIRSRYGWY